MKKQDTLVETMSALRERGYVQSFTMKPDHLEKDNDHAVINISDFTIDDVFRFEGETNPGDSCILYAISVHDSNEKGLMVNGYGAYADSISAEMRQKLQK